MKYTTLEYQQLLIYAAIVCMAYVACLFISYGFVVMPGLATINDAAFVAAFQGLETRFQDIENQSVLSTASSYGNIPAMISFPGAILFTIAALLIKRNRNYSRWLLAALILFGIGMITTVLYNLPSNEFIFRAGDPNLIDATQVRKEFNEASWSTWNHFRAGTSSLALVCLIRALHLLRIELQL